jgi:heme/copper-type cytochrome/quinol oxidase subunit 2
VTGGQRIWVGVVAAVSVIGGAVFWNSAQSAYDLNELLATSAPQQQVSALWYVHDLLLLVAFELVMLVVAVLTAAVFAQSRTESAPPPPPTSARHAESPEG